jgi:carbonic anhydrase/acetyltransferase-like protein (isoleucine patch superfamily)
MSISAFCDKVPQFGPGVFVHADATVIGDVVLEEGVTVWPGAVLRGDVEQIVVGASTSFQDGAVAHSDPGSPVRIGPGCIIGHGAIVHGATVGAGCLIGMHATLLNGCEVGEESIVGAQSLVPQGRSFPRRSLLVGTPARVMRELNDEDLAPFAGVHERYSARGRLYAEQGLGADLSGFRRRPPSASAD